MGNSVMLNGIEYAGEQIAYKDSTYELVSKVAYLIGVPLRIFQNEHEPPKIEIYNRLEQDKNARIIRNLCIIRTAIERNYRKINDIMRMEYRGLLSMPEILPMSSMQQLSNDGISFIKKSSTKLCHHIIEINRLCSATSFLRNWDSILEKKRANLRSISEPARLRQPPPQKHGIGTRKRAGSKHTGGATNSRPSRAFCPLVGYRLLSALYGPFCGPLRPFGGCPWGVTPSA